MKYFTQQLLEQYASLDHGIADKACEDWEEAIKKYNKYLKSIRKGCPPSVCELMDGPPKGSDRWYCLHDAEVLSMHSDGDKTYNMIVHIEPPSKEGFRTPFRMICGIPGIPMENKSKIHYIMKECDHVEPKNHPCITNRV